MPCEQVTACDAGLTEGRPDVVVEVMSSSSRRYDRIVKLRCYADIGIPEYWIADTGVHTIERFLLRDGHFYLAGAAADREIFRPESFEGLAIDLAAVREWPSEAPPAAETPPTADVPEPEPKNAPKPE